VVAPAAAWSDVGAWNAVWDISAKDGQGNALQGDALAIDTRDTLVMAQSRLVACVGLSDAVVIETADAVLVASRGHIQNVKQIVDQLKARGRSEAGSTARCTALGLVRQHRRGRALPGQAHRGQARRSAVAADAPPPRRALDRGQGTAASPRAGRVLLTENQTYIPLGEAPAGEPRCRWR
jgi:hypothetical protein